MSEESKVVLVTGASRGIGAAIADTLGESGYTVIGTATTTSGADSISQRFADKAILGAGMPLNVTDPDSISALLQSIVENFGAPTVLVNNAGITKDNILMRMKEDEWLDVINTNLNAVFRLSKACVRPMTKARWGRIVNISSVVGSMGNGGQSNYSAAKAGVSAMTVLWAQELAQYGIRVAGIAPGFTATEMVVSLRDDIKEKFTNSIPLRRFAETSEMSDGALFILKNEYYTGRMLEIDGGVRI